MKKKAKVLLAPPGSATDVAMGSPSAKRVAARRVKTFHKTKGKKLY